MPKSETSSALPGYVLVTGASGGVGLSLVEHLLSEGFTNIACQYRSKADKLTALLAAHDLHPEDHSFQADLTDETQVRRLREQANGKRGAIWGLVNLAGESTNAMVWKMSTDDFTRVLSANLLTTFLCTREFAPDMRAQGGGRIINTSSVAAFSGAVGAAHYCAAKAAVVGFTRATALELAPKNVSVNVVALGYLDVGLIAGISPPLQEGIKERTPLKRFGTGKEAAALIRYLLSAESSFATGQVFHLNGGYYS